jgi:hypothetical protein
MQSHNTLNINNIFINLYNHHEKKLTRINNYGDSYIGYWGYDYYGSL